MTVPATPRRAGPFTGNGSTTSFPFAFKVFSAEDVAVKRAENGVESAVTSGITVTLNADQDTSPGGTVVFAVAPTATQTIAIVDATELSQGTDLPTGGKYQAEVVENALDKLTILLQQIAELTGRALTLPATAASASTELPAPAAGKVIGWDDAGTGLRNIDPATLASIVAYANRRVLVANGGAATYTLAADPGGANNCVVAVGGIFQTPGVDYTVSGLVLTPTTPWPAGTGNVVVVYGEALPIGTLTADSLYYTGGGTGAALRTARDVLRERGIFLTDFAGAVADGTTGNDTPLALAKALAATLRTRVVIPAAAQPWYFASQIDLSDTFVSLVGQSQEKSVIKCPQGIKMRNSGTDGGDTCELLENLTILGTYTVGSTGVDRRFTSRSTMRRVVVQGFETGVKAIDAFVELYEQVEVKDCKYNWNLAGSNHATKLLACGSVGAGTSWGGSGAALLVANGGADSLQSCLSFDTCDFEFGSGNGADITATGVVTFHNCYMEAVGGTNFIVRQGDVVVEGGGEYIVKDSTGYLVDPQGGRITFRDRAGITSDGATRLYASLVKAGGSGSVVFESSTVFSRFLTTNSGSLPPLIGRGIVGVPFLKSAGRAFGWNPFTGNGSRVDTGDTSRITCTSAGALGVYQQMTTQPLINRSCLLLVRYRSNTAFSVSVTAGGGQSAPVTTLATLPTTAGALSVFVCPVAKITAATQTWLEFWKAAGWAVNDYLEIEEVLFVDSGAIENGTLSF